MADLENAADEKQLDAWRVTYLGKKGALTGLLRGLGALPADQRPAAGAAANNTKVPWRPPWMPGRRNWRGCRQKARAAERIDVTLPGRRPDLGHLHPTTRIMREMSASSRIWASRWQKAGGGSGTTTTSRP